MLKKNAAGCLALILMAAHPWAGRHRAYASYIGQTAAASDTGVYGQVDQFVAAAFGKDNHASVTVGVVAEGRLAWAKSYGFADIENKVPASADTVYRIGSITKQFTAVMLLQLVEQGKVHFSDPVEKYFPEINKVKGRFPGAPPITLIQLATHTSGLQREPEHTDTYLKGPVSEWENVLIAALAETSYEFEPGTQFSYSNIGYAILGAALGRAAGQPYTQYVQEHIFTPLGMADTAFEPNARIRGKIARGYLIDKDNKLDWQTADHEHAGRGYKVPNGAIYTTVGDLAKFVIFELGGGPSSVLKPEDLPQNSKRIITTGSRLGGGYGVGFQVIRKDNLTLLGHNGGVIGYEANAFFEPKSKTGVITLRNAVGEANQFHSDQVLLDIFEKLTEPKT
jgi:CubicO group peptidase (beta-lactamase class C family)